MSNDLFDQFFKKMNKDKLIQEIPLAKKNISTPSILNKLKNEKNEPKRNILLLDPVSNTLIRVPNPRIQNNHKIFIKTLKHTDIKKNSQELKKAIKNIQSLKNNIIKNNLEKIIKNKKKKNNKKKEISVNLKNTNTNKNTNKNKKIKKRKYKKI